MYSSASILKNNSFQSLKGDHLNLSPVGGHRIIRIVYHLTSTMDRKRSLHICDLFFSTFQFHNAHAMHVSRALDPSLAG